MLLRLDAAAESSFTFIHRAQCITRSSSWAMMSPSYAGQRMNVIFTDTSVTEQLNRRIGWELILEEMTALIWSTLHRCMRVSTQPAHHSRTLPTYRGCCGRSVLSWASGIRSDPVHTRRRWARRAAKVRSLAASLTKWHWGFYEGQ